MADAMSELTAKQIASRFGGPEGARYLHDLFQRQPITEGKIEVVEQFASLSVRVAGDKQAEGNGGAQ